MYRLKLLAIILVLCYTVGCTTVEITPFVYPTLNGQALENMLNERHEAYKARERGQYLRAIIARSRAYDELDLLKRSIGFQIGLRIKW